MTVDDLKTQGPRSREEILHFAREARSSFDDGYRRFTVKALCRDRFRSGPGYDGPCTDLSDDEIIFAAYGADGAATYWKAWLFGAESRTELVQTIAAHSAVNQDGWHRIWRTMVNALNRAPVGQNLFSDVRWMIDNPNTRPLIPTTLVETVFPAARRRSYHSTDRPSIGRPAGTGLDVLDAPFVERIVAMVRRGEAASVTAAARIVVGDGAGVPGGSGVDGKVDRLRRKAKSMLKAGE